MLQLRETSRQEEKTLTHGNPITQRERNTLCFAPDSDVANDGARFRSLDTEIGKCVLAYTRGFTYRRHQYQISTTRVKTMD